MKIPFTHRHDYVNRLNDPAARAASPDAERIPLLAETARTPDRGINPKAARLRFMRLLELPVADAKLPPLRKSMAPGSMPTDALPRQNWNLPGHRQYRALESDSRSIPHRRSHAEYEQGLQPDIPRQPDYTARLRPTREEYERRLGRDTPRQPDYAARPRPTREEYERRLVRDTPRQPDYAASGSGAAYGPRPTGPGLAQGGGRRTRGYADAYRALVKFVSYRPSVLASRLVAAFRKAGRFGSASSDAPRAPGSPDFSSAVQMQTLDQILPDRSAADARRRSELSEIGSNCIDLLRGSDSDAFMRFVDALPAEAKEKVLTALIYGAVLEYDLEKDSTECRALEALCENAAKRQLGGKIERYLAEIDGPGVSVQGSYARPVVGGLRILKQPAGRLPYAVELMLKTLGIGAGTPVQASPGNSRPNR